MASVRLAVQCLYFLQDVIGCTQEMDFILWPRNDIEKIVCLLFSRWKGADDEPFRPVQVRLLRLFRITQMPC